MVNIKQKKEINKQLLKKNDKKKLFTGITKKSPTTIMFQSSHETNTDTAIGQPDNNTITTKPKINNIHFYNISTSKKVTQYNKKYST